MMSAEDYLKKSLKQLDGDLINHWYILALEHEIAVNKPISRTLYDRPYVLYRDDKNDVRVQLDQCIHRGAPLSKGHCEKGGIRCPYHGWLYSAEGEVVDIPSENEEKKLSARKWKLPEVPRVIQDGCVWIWIGDLSKKTEKPSWRFPNADKKGWVKYFMITDFDNEVTHLVQNFMDVPHTVYVHDKWFRKKRSIKVRITIEAKEGRVKVTYHQNDDAIGFMKRILNPNSEAMEHTDEFIFPNITRVDYNFGKRSFIINSQCTPVTRFKTRVYTWIAYDIGFFSRVLKSFFKFYTRQVITQDVDIMKKHGDVLRVLGENAYHSTGADELHIAIQKMRETGAENKERPKDMDFVREREFWI